MPIITALEQSVRVSRITPVPKSPGRELKYSAVSEMISSMETGTSLGFLPICPYLSAMLLSLFTSEFMWDTASAISVLLITDSSSSKSSSQPIREERGVLS